MESNKYRISIEPGIAPICEALNQIPDVKTIWSCEGHPKDGHRPYVVFAAPQDVAFAIDRSLYYEKGRILRFTWRLIANFQDNGSLQWIIEPNDVRFVSRSILGRALWTRRQVDADILELARMISKLRGA